MKKNNGLKNGTTDNAIIVEKMEKIDTFLYTGYNLDMVVIISLDQEGINIFSNINHMNKYVARNNENNPNIISINILKKKSRS